MDNPSYHCILVCLPRDMAASPTCRRRLCALKYYFTNPVNIWTVTERIRGSFMCAEKDNIVISVVNYEYPNKPSWNKRMVLKTSAI